MDSLVFCESKYLNDHQIALSEESMKKNGLRENQTVQIKNKVYLVVKADSTESKRYIEAGVPKKKIAFCSAAAQLHAFSIYTKTKPKTRSKKLKQTEIAYLVGKEIAKDFEITVLTNPNNTFKVRVDYKPWASVVSNGVSEENTIRQALMNLSKKMPELKDRIEQSMQIILTEEVTLCE